MGSVSARPTKKGTSHTRGRLAPILPDWAAPQGILHLVIIWRRGLLPRVRAVIDFAAKVLHPRWEAAT